MPSEMALKIGNGKVCPMSDEKKMRKSTIHRHLKRTLSTAPYETLVIEIGFEEEIEWKSLQERQKKVDNWNTLLIQDFKQSSDRILTELGITHKKAYFNNPSEETQAKYQKQAKEQAKVEDLDSLDSLDSLDFITNTNEPQVGRGLDLGD